MDIIHGFINLFGNPAALGYVFLGAITGIIVGSIPGLTSAAAIAMLVPVTYYLDPLSALAFLYVIGKSGRFGGSISSILFNTPGTVAAAATMIDGHPMCKKGQAGKAIKTAAVASIFGDFMGDMLLIFGALGIASLTEDFGPPEYFAVYMTAFLIISSVVGSSVIKGLISTAAGITAAMIGIDPISSMPRLHFGSMDFQSGLSLVPILIGMFVLSEIAVRLEKFVSKKGSRDVSHATGKAGNRFTFSEFKRCLPVMIRSSITGAFIGIIPGLGSSLAAFTSWGEEKRRSKNPEQWGKGIVEGIAAPESANNAVSGPSMIPLMALGVPGSTIAAILMGVFLIHGIQPGPLIFQTSRELVYSLFAAGLLGIAIYGLIGYFGGSLIGGIIAKLPTRQIYPYIFLTCFVSAYSARTNVFDIFVMCAAGLLGYVMRKQDYPIPAFIIAFVLGKGAEQTFRQSIILTDAGAWIFLQRPVVLLFFGIGLFIVGGRIWKKYRRQRRALA